MKFFDLVIDPRSDKTILNEKFPAKTWQQVADIVGATYRTLKNYLYKKGFGKGAPVAIRALLMLKILKEEGKISQNMDVFEYFLSKEEIQKVKEECKKLS